MGERGYQVLAPALITNFNETLIQSPQQLATPSSVIGENKDYKQEVLSVECTNCEVQCFVPPIGESKHLVENKAEDKGEKVANMRQRIR